MADFTTAPVLDGSGEDFIAFPAEVFGVFLSSQDVLSVVFFVATIAVILAPRPRRRARRMRRAHMHPFLRGNEIGR